MLVVSVLTAFMLGVLLANIVRERIFNKKNLCNNIKNHIFAINNKSLSVCRYTYYDF